MSYGTYVCAACGNEYEKGRSDEEARAEFTQRFGHPPDPEDEIVCDECFQEIMAWVAAGMPPR